MVGQILSEASKIITDNAGAIVTTLAVALGLRFGISWARRLVK